MSVPARNEGGAAEDGLWDVPRSWLWSTVAHVGEVSLGRQRAPANHAGPYMRPYVRAANVTWSGWDLSDVKEMNFDPADFERYRLLPGDVLLNEGSGSAKEVGKPAIWRGDIADCCFQNTLIRVRPVACTSEYLYHYFLQIARSQGFVPETQGVNIHHIGREGLASFPIPVPPLAEQRRIVARIETLFERTCRARVELERVVECGGSANQTLRLLSRLEQAILVRAFRGELVAQDPADEPAAALLARRAANGEAARPRRHAARRV